MSSGNRDKSRGQVRLGRRTERLIGSCYTGSKGSVSGMIGGSCHQSAGTIGRSSMGSHPYTWQWSLACPEGEREAGKGSRSVGQEQPAVPRSRCGEGKNGIRCECQAITLDVEDRKTVIVRRSQTASVFRQSKNWRSIEPRRRRRFMPVNVITCDRVGRLAGT